MTDGPSFFISHGIVVINIFMLGLIDPIAYMLFIIFLHFFFSVFSFKFITDPLTIIKASWFQYVYQSICVCWEQIFYIIFFSFTDRIKFFQFNQNLLFWFFRHLKISWLIHLSLVLFALHIHIHNIPIDLSTESTIIQWGYIWGV